MKGVLALFGAAVALVMFVSPVRAGSFILSDWAESYTDGGGTYHSPSAVAPYVTTLTGGVLSAGIPTDASQASPDNEVTNYVRTGDFVSGTAMADYSGTLLGNLSGKTALTATFNITNSTLASGSPFTTSELVGESTPPSGLLPANTAVRLVFTGGDNPVNANGAGDFEPNEWWSDSTAAFVTSLNNGQDVTLTVDFVPSLWSNFDGKVGTDPLVAGQFASALTDVTRIGLSFGSGDFFSDGFAFNTGGTAAINLDSIATTAPVPLPSTAWTFLTLIGLVACYSGFKRIGGLAALV